MQSITRQSSYACFCFQQTMLEYTKYISSTFSFSLYTYHLPLSMLVYSSQKTTNPNNNNNNPNTQKQYQYSDVELRHQRNLKDLKAAYDAEKAALDNRDISNANEIEQLHRKCRCLTNL